MMKKVCLICGNEFEVPNWKYEKAKYCSRKCTGIAQRSKDVITCPCCGKQFHRKPYHIKRNKGEYGFYCSKQCAKMGMRLRMTGEHNHQYGLKGALNSSFKGIITTKSNNNLIDLKKYVPQHPFADKSGRVSLHRLIVENNWDKFGDEYFLDVNGKHYLKREYRVHHIDQDHNNNDITNLTIVTCSEHATIHNKLNPRKHDCVTGRFIKKTKNHNENKHHSPIS